MSDQSVASTLHIFLVQVAFGTHFPRHSKETAEGGSFVQSETNFVRAAKRGQTSEYQNAELHRSSAKLTLPRPNSVEQILALTAP